MLSELPLSTGHCSMCFKPDRQTDRERETVTNAATLLSFKHGKYSNTASRLQVW